MPLAQLPSYGVWTPVFTFATPGNQSIAYSAQVGTYMRVGNLVIATFNLGLSTFTHTTASGAANVTGLPFAAASRNANDYRFGAGQWHGITKASYTEVVARIGPGASLIELVASGSGQVAAVVTFSDMPTGGAPGFRFTIPYEAA